MATTATPGGGTASALAGSKELRRDIGLIGLSWASLGSIIGSGWLFGAYKALGYAGPSAIFSWVVGAVAITILALVHAELGAMWPVSGGTARFPHIVYGGFGGAFFGWFSWLQAATVAPIEVLAMMTYAAGYFSWAKGFFNNKQVLTGEGIGVAIGLMAIMVIINLVSIRFLANINSGLTWWKLAVPVVTIIILLGFHFHSSNFTAADGFAPAGAKGVFQAVASGGIIFAVLGFEQADQLAGEARNPKRDIPVGIIMSMVIGSIVYILLQVAFLGAIPHHLLPTHWLSLNNLSSLANGPFALLATAIGIGWLATVLRIDAVASPGGTGLIYTTATSRVSYGLARNGYYPRPFESLTPKRVPWFGLIVTFVLGCIIFLPFPSWNSLVSIITSVSVLMYAGAPLALASLRQRTPDAHRPYRLAGASVIAPLAFIVANCLVLFTGWTADWKIGAATLVGIGLIFVNIATRRPEERPRMNWRAAAWIPVWLAGLLVLVYLSSFNDTRTTYFIGFGWDILVTAVWAGLIYIWAIRSALPAAEINAMVEETVIPEDAELAGAELVG